MAAVNLGQSRRRCRFPFGLFFASLSDSFRWRKTHTSLFSLSLSTSAHGIFFCFLDARLLCFTFPFRLQSALPVALVVINGTEYGRAASFVA